MKQIEFVAYPTAISILNYFEIDNGICVLGSLGYTGKTHLDYIDPALFSIGSVLYHTLFTFSLILSNFLICRKSEK